MIRATVLAAALTLTGCAPLPESYPVPPQRPVEDGPEPEGLRSAITFDDPRLKDYLISGFLDAAPGQSWLWAGRAPEIRLRLESAANLRLHAKITFPHQSHQPLLPITVTATVNGKPVGTQTYRSAGEVEFLKDVPDGFAAVGENRVRLEVDRVYVAEADGAQLGMIVTAVGFQVRK